MKELVREWVGSSRFHITPQLSTWSKARAQLFAGRAGRRGWEGVHLGLVAHQETVFNKFGFLYCQHAALS